VLTRVLFVQVQGITTYSTGNHHGRYNLETSKGTHGSVIDAPCPTRQVALSLLALMTVVIRSDDVALRFFTSNAHCTLTDNLAENRANDRISLQIRRRLGTVDSADLISHVQTKEDHTFHHTGASVRADA
jgi:hypothetical protein